MATLLFSSLLFSCFLLWYINSWEVAGEGGHWVAAYYVITVWLLIDYYVITIWLLCDYYVIINSWEVAGEGGHWEADYYVITMWWLIDYYVITIWLLIDYYVITIWLLCDYYVITIWLLCDHYVIINSWKVAGDGAHWEAASSVRCEADPHGGQVGAFYRLHHHLCWVPDCSTRVACTHCLPDTAYFELPTWHYCKLL